MSVYFPSSTKQSVRDGDERRVEISDVSCIKCRSSLLTFPPDNRQFVTVVKVVHWFQSFLWSYPNTKAELRTQLRTFVIKFHGYSNRQDHQLAKRVIFLKIRTKVKENSPELEPRLVGQSHIFNAAPCFWTTGDEVSKHYLINYFIREQLNWRLC